MITILLLVVIEYCLAHNWVASTARARGRASTVGPCQSRRGDVPHVQIGKGQEFIAEWATGHGATAYFALIRAEHEDKLRSLSAKTLDAYIAAGPNGDQVPEARFRKLHRKKPTGTVVDNVKKSGTQAAFFDQQITTDMSEYRDPTPPLANRKDHPVVSYKMTHMMTDRKVVNPNHPFILSVQRYTQVADQPGEVDFTNFEIPGNPSEPGKYILWYYWRAYRDCIDIEYTGLPTPIAAPYGVLSNTITWQRIDHCTFPDQKQIMTRCIQMVDNINDCVKGCVDGRYCGGIIVAPLELPDTVSPNFKDIHPLPFGELEPLNMGSKPRTTPLEMCKKSDYASIKDPKNTLLCVGVKTRGASDTFDVYETTKDPASPYFYSTCYLPVRHVQFDSLPPPPTKFISQWKAHNKCIDCENAAQNAFVSQRPVWKMADVCVNCDKDFDSSNISEPVKPIVPWTVMKKYTACDGIKFSQCDGNYKHCRSYAKAANADTCNDPTSDPPCYKALAPLFARKSAVTEMGCYQAALQDDECSEHVFMTEKGNKCVCYRKRACCKPCDLVNTRYFNHRIIPAKQT